jgi:hypothetical protein
MVRKGQSGAQKDDGMTPEIAATLRGWIDKLVPDAECRRWMYEGGQVPTKTVAS